MSYTFWHSPVGLDSLRLKSENLDPDYKKKKRQ